MCDGCFLCSVVLVFCLVGWLVFWWFVWFFLIHFLPFPPEITTFPTEMNADHLMMNS